LLVYAALLAAPVLPEKPLLLLTASILLLGIYYAATDGILMALTSALLAIEQRATGIALVTTTLGLGKLCAGMGFGLLWSLLPIGQALLIFALGLLTTLLLSTWLLWRHVPAAAQGQPRS
jgi:hypothetical protein